MTATLVLRCDASPALGLGHLARGLVIADAWGARGGRVVVAMTTGADLGVARVVAAGHQVERLAAVDDPAALVALAVRHGARHVVVDHYGVGAATLAALAAAGRRTLVVDDLGDRTLPVDVIVNPNADAEDRAYEARPDTVVLRGPAYAPLGAAYRRARPAVPPPRGAGAILIAFGGSDPDDWTAALLRALAPAGRPLIAVVGAGYRGDAEWLADGARAIVVHRDLPELVAPMQQADVFLGAGGSTAWEACALALPLVLRPFVANQRGNARGLGARGVAVDATDLDAAAVAAAALALAPGEATAMAARAWALIDGAGADRIVEALA